MFTVRTQAEIRETILASLRARYRAQQLELATGRDTPAYNDADSYALPVEAIEARALDLTAEFFPDTASEVLLERHRELTGLARKSATAARFTVQLTGIAASTWTTSGVLTTPDGIRYKPTVGGAIGFAGAATVIVEAQTTGAQGNKLAGTTLTWQSAPTGIDPLATVTSAPATIVAVDDETDLQLAARIIAWWQERPGGANRSQYRVDAENVAGVTEAYVYRLLHPTLGPHTLGAVTVLLMGPPGARIPGAGTVDAVKAVYFSTDGGTVPAAVNPDDITVAVPSQQVQNVTLQVTLGAGFSFPFAGTYTVAATPSTATRVYLTAAPTLIVTGHRVAVKIPGVRGGYKTTRVTARNTAVAPYYIDVEDLGGVPIVGSTVRPASSNWDAIVSALLAVFDRLGPGDVAPEWAHSARWPGMDQQGPATLYRSALVAAAMGVPGLAGAPLGVSGVLSANVTTPGTDVTPPLKTVIVPGDIVITA